MIPIRLGYLFDFLFTFERTTITVEYRLLQENNDAQLVFIRFQNAVPGIWKIDIKPAMQTTGDFHIWASDGRIPGGRGIFSGIKSRHYIYRTFRRKKYNDCGFL